MAESKLINWLIPENIQKNRSDLGQAKLIIGVTLSLVVVAVVMALQTFSMNAYSNGFLILFCGVLSIFILMSMKWTGTNFWAGNGIVFILFSLLSFLIGKSTGVFSESTPWYTVVVILSFMMTGKRASIFWSVCSTGVIGVFYLMEINGHEFKTVTTDPRVFFVSYTVLVLIMIALGWILRSTNANSQKSLALEKEKSEEKAKRLDEVIVEVKRVMAMVADYDLSERITGSYEGQLKELQSSINQSIEILSQTIRKSREGSDQVDINASELSASAQTIAHGASQQAAGLEEISSTMNEIGSQAKITNENASKAQGLSNKALQEVQNGNRQMESMLLSMKEINQTSSNMTKVIKLIDEIAFQTNLLALNAAVEAARAGKYGKGFAVVADEVRSLAVRSAESAGNTNSLIEQSIKEIEKGTQNADQTALALDQIDQVVGKMNDLVSEISMASQNQTNSIQEINANLIHMNEIVQQNSSISEETAATSEQLSSQASSLQQDLYRFSLD